LNIHTRQHGAEIIDGSSRSTIYLRNLGIRNALDDDAEHLIVRKLTTLSIAQFADERPEVHGKVSVFNQLPQEAGEFHARSDLHTMHHADRSKFSDVPVKTLGLLQAVGISRHHVLLDAGNGPLLAHHPNPDASSEYSPVR
jgi:hypothetical protein